MNISLLTCFQENPDPYQCWTDCVEYMNEDPFERSSNAIFYVTIHRIHLESLLRLQTNETYAFNLPWLRTLVAYPYIDS